MKFVRLAKDFFGRPAVEKAWDGFFSGLTGSLEKFKAPERGKDAPSFLATQVAENVSKGKTCFGFAA